MTVTEYKTVEKENSDEFVEKRSRFIGHVKPVSTEAEAVEFVNSVKQKHWDATHNVWAYVLKDNNIYRYSDDGEPSGTAGVPVLDVLLKSKVVNVAVVVTRYFGGTLLGAGGLVRAYSHASKIAVESGGIITMALCNVFSVTVDYSFYDRLNIILADFGTIVEGTEFTDKVTVTASIRASRFEELNAKLFDQSNGQYLAVKIDERFGKASDY